MQTRINRALVVSLATPRGRKTLVAAAAGVLTGMCLVFGFVMTEWHADVGRALGASGQSVASAVAHEVDRNVELLDLSIQAIAREWGSEEVRNLAPHLRDLVLFDNAMRAPGFGMILVVDRDGRIEAGSIDGWSSDTRINDRDYFKVHTTSPDLGLFVSKPFISRLSGRRSIALSRRMTDGAGGFAGVVVGTIDLDYLSSVYAGLTIGTGGAVALLRLDGTVIAREPPPPTIARPWIGDQDGFTAMRSSRSGTFEGTSPIDDRQTIVSFHRIGNLPLVQVVEVGGEAVYKIWWRRATAVAGLLAVLSVCVLGLCLALTLELGRRAAAEASLRRIAGTDSLTGLANRRSFDAALAAAWSDSIVSGEPVALLMADADAFKAYNDLFGHQAGDEVLLRVAGCLDALARSRGGVACRWGGEEFAIVLRGLGEPEAVALADEFCRSVRGLDLDHPRGVGGVVTVSVGVAAATPSTDMSARALLTGADAALYRAKAEGRDRSCARPRPRAIPATTRDERLGSLG
jgi:diguanylate cyclase (GGDEF)-like protein